MASNAIERVPLTGSKDFWSIFLELPIDNILVNGFNYLSF